MWHHNPAAAAQRSRPRSRRPPAAAGGRRVVDDAGRAGGRGAGHLRRLGGRRPRGPGRRTARRGQLEHRPALRHAGLPRLEPGATGADTAATEPAHIQPQTHRQARPARPGSVEHEAAPGPATVVRARELARHRRPPGRRDGAAAHHRLDRAGVLRMAGLEGADAEGIPWVNRLVDARAPSRSASSTGWPCRCGTRWRAARAGSATTAADPRPAGGRRLGRLPRSRGPGGRPRRDGAPCGRARGRRAGSTGSAPRASGCSPATRCDHKPVDLPDRGHRGHPRGRPAGPGRRPRGRRRHRRHPLHRAVAAGLRARGGDPRGVRRHLRDAGELPDHARRRSTTCPRSSAATSG